MAQTTITFEDPNDPPNPGIIRVYSNTACICSTDNGAHPVSDVQVGWKIMRDKEPWLTVLEVVTE
jgi:hypothetical protein